MSLREKIAELYGLETTSKWGIIDSLDDLHLLDGVYQGLIVSSVGNFKLDWVFREVQIIRTSSPVETFDGKIQLIPEGPIVRHWSHSGKDFWSSTTKLDDRIITEAINGELDGVKLKYGTYIVTLPETTVTYRKRNSGIFKLDEIPFVTSVSEVNKWLGFNISGDPRLTDGENCLLTSPDGQLTIIKPPSKVWREVVAIGPIYSDHQLLGSPIRRRYFHRWIEALSVKFMSNEIYQTNFPIILEKMNNEYDRVINMYFAFLRAISLDALHRSKFYQDLFGVDEMTDYRDVIASFKENGYPKSLYEHLLSDLWDLLKTEDELPNKLLRDIKRRMFNAGGKTWESFKETVNNLSGNDLRLLLIYFHFL